MSTHRFLPNSHGHDDLRQEPGADASADALDALLNEIAQHEGSSRTRPGARQERPHLRTDPDAQPGTDDLSAAARAFHRRFEEEERHDPGASAHDPTLWEQIMATTASTTPPGFVANPLSPGIPAPFVIPRNEESFDAGNSQTACREKIPRRLGMTKDVGGTRRRDTTRERHSAPTAPVWRGFANATLALVIVLAGFATWLAYDRLDGSGTDDPPATMPGVAMVPGTPEATEPVDGTGVPISTPTPAYACDFSRDIPIFQQVDESPVEGTALLLTTAGDLVLTCPEEPDPVVLTSGINQVSPMNWPGIVSMLGEGAPGAQPMTVVNVMTGGMVDVGVPPESMTDPWTQPIDTPWLVAPAAGAPGDWAITDLRNMNSRLYSDLSGEQVPDGAVLTASARGDTLVVVPWITTGDMDTGSIPQGKGMSPTALVVNGSLDATNMIALPAGLPPIVDLRLAPDGAHLALLASENLAPPEGATVYSVIRTADGHEVGRSGDTAVQNPREAMAWVQGGAAFAYLQDSSLMLLPVGGDGTPEPLLDVNDSLAVVRTTYDPDVVTVSTMQFDEVDTETPGDVQFLIYSVNTVTGESIAIEGYDARNIYGWELPPSRYLVLSDSQVDDTTPTTYRVVDAVTGEQVGTLPNARLAPLEGHVSLGRNALAISDDGETMVIGFSASQVWLLREVDGEPEIRQLPATPGLDPDSLVSADLAISPDGSLLSMTLDDGGEGDRFLLDLTDPGADWSVYPTQAGDRESGVHGYGPANIFFVPGTGD